jgi:hypothetical protein
MNVHRERIDAHKNAHTCDYADILPVISTHNEYVHTVTSYSHILSPRGAGIDCHRTWEALYLGTVPIVKESVLTDYFKSIGVPLIVVKEWSDITNTKHMSELMKIDFPNIDNHPALYIDFWLNMIHGKRSLLQIEQSRKIM